MGVVIKIADKDDIKVSLKLKKSGNLLKNFSKIGLIKIIPKVAKKESWKPISWIKIIGFKKTIIKATKNNTLIELEILPNCNANNVTMPIIEALTTEAENPVIIENKKIKTATK